MMRAPARKDGCPAPAGPPARGTPARASQAASERWVAALAGTGPAREQALADLHDLLLRGAHHEIRRRRAGLAGVPDRELEELAGQAANDAMVAILAKLPTFRGDSRFTTWAYKFVLLEAGVKLRRRAWQGREVTLEPAAWPAFPASGPTAQEGLERAELIGAIRTAVASSLTPHQREVFVALALNGVPIDVLAERLTTTRGALYKTLHDARRKLREELAKAGLDVRRTT
jgi:RNA polymerase sigma-70 factor (ECF subfamily)